MVEPCGAFTQIVWVCSVPSGLCVVAAANDAYFR